MKWPQLSGCADHSCSDHCQINWLASCFVASPGHNCYFLFDDPEHASCKPHPFLAISSRETTAFPVASCFQCSWKIVLTHWATRSDFIPVWGPAWALVRCLIDPKHLEWPTGLCVISVSRKCSICAVLQTPRPHQGQHQQLNPQSCCLWVKFHDAISGFAHKVGTNRYVWVCAESMKHILVSSSERTGGNEGRPAFLQLSDSNFALNPSQHNGLRAEFGLRYLERTCLQVLGWKYIKLMTNVQQDSNMDGWGPLSVSVKSEPRSCWLLTDDPFPSPRHKQSP